LLAPRFTPHLSHLCTHKLASLTVLRIVNQKSEPAASRQIVEALFLSTNDTVLTDVLGDQINGVAVVHKVLQSPALSSHEKQNYLEATKRVLIDLKVTTAQAYRRLIEEVGLPIPSFANSPTSYGAGPPTPNGAPRRHASGSSPRSLYDAQGAVPNDHYEQEHSDSDMTALASQNQNMNPHAYRSVPPAPVAMAAPYSQALPRQNYGHPTTFSPANESFHLPVGMDPSQAQAHSMYARRVSAPLINGSPANYGQTSALPAFAPSLNAPPMGRATPMMAPEPQLAPPYPVSPQMHNPQVRSRNNCMSY
jgi:protein JSN1